MSTVFEQINDLPLIDILDKVGISYRVRGNNIELFDDGKINNYWKGDIAKGIITDFSGKRSSGDRITFLMNHLNRDKGEIVNWFKTNFNITDDEQASIKRQPKRETFIKEMPCDNNVVILKKYLLFRGFKEDQLTNISDIASELGSVEKLFMSEGVKKDTLLFPMYKNGQRVGIKMRTVDGTPFTTGKSGNVKGGHTGLIYKNITDTAIIVEGEPDYLCLRVLGFDSVIGNLGGIAANKEEIKTLTKNCKKVIFLYDNDGPGLKAMNGMDIGRPIYIPNFPKIEGYDEYDINDLVKMGWKKEDFQNLLDNSTLTTFKKEESLFLDRILFNRIKGEFYDIVDMSFVSRQKIADIYMHVNNGNKIKGSDIVAPIYDGICYLDGGRKGFYNVFNRDTIETPSTYPLVHEEIEFLISNICGNDEKNIEWLEKAILYKYTHINDSIVPAIVFHGAGGSGKGLFVKMLSRIFGEENTLEGLSQDSIESRFSHYSGRKLIVEFKEISVSSTIVGKKNMEKLKTFIMEDRINVEKKGQDPITIENIAWFIMSSNSSRPVQLDSVDAGNRRFTVLKTGGPTGRVRGASIRKVIDDPVNIQNYLAYLFARYGEIDSIEALENEDKTNLENLTEQESDKFFQWVEKLYPNVNKISVLQRNMLLREFYEEMGEACQYIDSGFTRIFNTSLSTRYICPTDSKITIDGKASRFYSIVKKVEGSGLLPDSINKALCKKYEFI